MDYSEALKLLENGDIPLCINFFKENGYNLEYGYSLMLSGDLDNAERVLSTIDSHRADWVCMLISIIKEEKTVYPTYFQIRNFLEIDINLFIKANRCDYVNAILRIIEHFQKINNETYKFVARVLLKNGYKKEAKIFLDRSLDFYYNDVELHYLFVEYYLSLNDYENAKKSVKNCIKINPNYYPARKTQKALG